MRRQGFPIVISGPSGVGKSTIYKRVLEADGGVAYSVSVTTRPMRPGEANKVDYEFVSPAEFDALVARDELAEWALVHGHQYGTRRSAIESHTKEGRDVVMDLDVQGGMSIKRLYPEGVLVFVLPPSWEALERRLRSRATDSPEVIETRLRNAREEMNWAPRYDYAVENESLDEAVRQTLVIIEAERLRASRFVWNGPVAARGTR
ncbi:MAG: guanylate kinase [Candidatus Eisenbacteria bacterium]|nr:guanylate kinase [Chloroflexota bacterium]MBM3308218.1 guanylate kinase [Candidatus Eisenbacteria bacterium]